MITYWSPPRRRRCPGQRARTHCGQIAGRSLCSPDDNDGDGDDDDDNDDNDDDDHQIRVLTVNSTRVDIINSDQKTGVDVGLMIIVQHSRCVAREEERGRV